METRYKLTYFDIRGLAEQIRLLLADNKIPYEETRLKSDEEWAALKHSFAFGQVPCLQDDDVKIVQTGAIMRHLARHHHLCGRTEFDRTFADMFYEGIRDVHNRYLRLIYKEYEKKDDFVSNYLPDALSKLDAFLKTYADGTAFILGDTVCYADYALFELLDILLILSPECLLNHPTLRSFHQRFNQRTSLQSYLLNRAASNVRVNWNGKE